MAILVYRRVLWLMLTLVVVGLVAVGLHQINSCVSGFVLSTKMLQTCWGTYQQLENVWVRSSQLHNDNCGLPTPKTMGILRGSPPPSRK